MSTLRLAGKFLGTFSALRRRHIDIQIINRKERKEHKNEKNMLFWSLVPFSLRSLRCLWLIALCKFRRIILFSEVIYLKHNRRGVLAAFCYQMGTRQGCRVYECAKLFSARIRKSEVIESQANQFPFLEGTGVGSHVGIKLGPGLLEMVSLSSSAVQL